MINGAHASFYSDDADATRVTLAKVLGTRSVDAGGGWPIFALPPAKIAVHPAERGGRAEFYLMTTTSPPPWPLSRSRASRSSGRSAIRVGFADGHRPFRWGRARPLPARHPTAAEPS
jgi:hypothetical protein